MGKLQLRIIKFKIIQKRSTAMASSLFCKANKGFFLVVNMFERESISKRYF